MTLRVQPPAFSIRSKIRIHDSVIQKFYPLVLIQPHFGLDRAYRGQRGISRSSLIKRARTDSPLANGVDTFNDLRAISKKKRLASAAPEEYVTSAVPLFFSHATNSVGIPGRGKSCLAESHRPRQRHGTTSLWAGKGKRRR